MFQRGFREVKPGHISKPIANLSKRNYLDRASVGQAYVSGMKEDLHFKGAELTVVNTLYSVGYLV